MQAVQLLWVDDEIDLLKPHILFLQQKGYEVASLTNGYDAIDYLQENPIDLVILDESMPGMTGLETLIKIKELFPYMPIVMATKNEAEYVMEDAIGNQISDYLIKPIHPNQVLISIKKIKIYFNFLKSFYFFKEMVHFKTLLFLKFSILFTFCTGHDIKGKKRFSNKLT